jgi:hypothetical protein
MPGLRPSLESMLTHGVTQRTVRTPSVRIIDTIHAASGDWCGLNSQVLYWVAHGESITIASSGMPCRRNPLKSSSTSSWCSCTSRLFQNP